MSKKVHWNKLYEREGYRFGKEPLPLLKSQMHRFRKGKALELAMGEGRNAVYLAKEGFQVQGFDVSDIAIEKAKKLAYDNDVSIDAKVADLDLYIFPLMAFDVIVMSYFKPVPRYYNEIFRALAQGGCVVIENYTTDQLHQKPIEGLQNEDYFYPNEILKNLKDLQILFYNEDEMNGKYVVQCVAKKPTDKDAVKYGFAKEDIHPTQSKYKAAEDLFKKK
ncbi:MAG: hypothetical protein A3B70_06025 [Deltaproteobacteria bacterium RIFCSPHIGHO2_02_FULL_40_11]|nr:MAG: hypothetical protein A3B70_06025 [Deltaproteobacteria bacterium RIFCSPHIGHO2_02_FULL_40_11]